MSGVEQRAEQKALMQALTKLTATGSTTQDIIRSEAHRPSTVTKEAPMADSYSKTETDAKLEAFEHKIGRQFDQQLGDIRREMEAMRGEIRAGFAELGGKVSTMQAGVETKVTEVNGTVAVVRSELNSVKSAIGEAKGDQRHALAMGLTILGLVLTLGIFLSQPLYERWVEDSRRSAIEAPTAAPGQLPPNR